MFREEHGNFGSGGCMWEPSITHLGDDYHRMRETSEDPDLDYSYEWADFICKPTVLDVDVRCRFHWRVDCMCVGDLLYRGACIGCDWEGPVRGCENEASEDANDHAFPGWRDYPVVPELPEERKKRAKVLDAWAHVFPADYRARGGPTRSYRKSFGTRHVPGRGLWGGYDMAVVVDSAHPEVPEGLPVPVPPPRVKAPARTTPAPTDYSQEALF